MTKLTRRRFLSISAAAALPGLGPVQSAEWRGVALGADAQIRLEGLPEDVLKQVPHILEQVESQFSLYRPDSVLARLNDQGQISAPQDMFLDLLGACDRAHRQTGGLFDPSVQTLWQAYANGTRPAKIGWQQVSVTPSAIRLSPRQALTFNGIAQGYATDLIIAHLKARGARHVLVNIGEYRALGGPWRLGVSDPAHGQIGTLSLIEGAIATSSPNATMVAGQPHIFHPKGGRAVWSTVSVEADTATMADAASTAFTLAPKAEIQQMVLNWPEIRRVLLVSPGGDVSTIS